MSETVIAALIAGGVTLVVCLLNNMFQQKRMASTVAEQQWKATNELRHEIQLLSVKLETVSENVEKHNNVIERTYHLEKEAVLQEEKIKVANHRIEDLEKLMYKEE